MHVSEVNNICYKKEKENCSNYKKQDFYVTSEKYEKLFSKLNEKYLSAI